MRFERYGLCPDGRNDRVERGAGFRTVRTTGLRHVGPAAAALAAQHFRALLDEIDRVEARREIVGDADRDAGLAVAGDADDGDNALPDLLLAGIDEALEILHLDALHRATEEFDVADVAHGLR